MNKTITVTNATEATSHTPVNAGLWIKANAADVAALSAYANIKGFARIYSKLLKDSVATAQHAVNNGEDFYLKVDIRDMGDSTDVFPHVILEALIALSSAKSVNVWDSANIREALKNISEATRFAFNNENPAVITKSNRDCYYNVIALNTKEEEDDAFEPEYTVITEEINYDDDAWLEDFQGNLFSEGFEEAVILLAANFKEVSEAPEPTPPQGGGAKGSAPKQDQSSAELSTKAPSASLHEDFRAKAVPQYEGQVESPAEQKVEGISKGQALWQRARSPKESRAFNSGSRSESPRGAAPRATEPRDLSRDLWARKPRSSFGLISEDTTPLQKYTAEPVVDFGWI